VAAVAEGEEEEGLEEEEGRRHVVHHAEEAAPEEGGEGVARVAPVGRGEGEDEAGGGVGAEHRDGEPGEGEVVAAVVVGRPREPEGERDDGEENGGARDRGDEEVAVDGGGTRLAERGEERCGEPAPCERAVEDGVDPVGDGADREGRRVGGGAEDEPAG
jgi:hypothetical protein